MKTRKTKSIASTIVWIPTVLLLAGSVLALPGCGGSPRYYLAKKQQFSGKARIVVLPPVNFGRRQEAPQLLMNSILIELLNTGHFEPADPGEVEKFIVKNRIRLTDRLPLSSVKEISEHFKTQYLMTGSISQFDFMQAGNEVFPVISLNLRIISTKTGEVLWAATHTRRGDDSETVFGLGKVRTLEKMSEIVIHDMIATLER